MSLGDSLSGSHGAEKEAKRLGAYGLELVDGDVFPLSDAVLAVGVGRNAWSVWPFVAQH